ASTYDGLNRPTAQTDAVGVQTVLTYDKANNKLSEQNVTTGLTTAWQSYDGLNRPASMTRNFVDPVTHQPVSYVTGYAYFDAQHARETTDPRGFVTREQLSGLDQVVESTVDKAGLALLTTHQYDALGKPIGARDPNGNLTRSLYDGLGRLVKTTDALGQ